jgi:translation initiation factor 4E
MQEEIETVQKSKLNDKWTFYYHLPDDKQWDLSSYKHVMKDISSLEQLISVNEKTPEKIVKYCMLFVMRNGITPMWEDKENRDGGCFSFKVSNKLVYDVWKQLFYSLCGETLCKDVSHSKKINGITISPKKNFCIIKIWLKDCSVQDPNILINIPNLSKQGCLFKKHAPEF